MSHFPWITFLTLLTAPLTSSAEVRLGSPVRLPYGGAQLTVTGQSSGLVTLQSSTDLNSWMDIATNQLNGIPWVVIDPLPGGTRFYRISLVSTGESLGDLSQLQNQVFTAGEGFNTIQYAPDGNLAFIVWRGNQLLYRQRNPAGNWLEETISGGGGLFQENSSREDWHFQPGAALLFDSASRANVFKIEGAQVVHYFRGGSGQWTVKARLSAPDLNGGIAFLRAAIGTGNKLHLGLIGVGDTPAIVYGTDLSGNWQWSRVTNIAAYPRYYLPPSYAARYFSLAVDAENAAHIAFTPEFRIHWTTSGHARPYSELHYTSNRGGAWSFNKVYSPPNDDSGDAGLGYSIAIGKNNQPVIAHWYVERGNGGSAQESYLYLAQFNNGIWSRSLVLKTPDGYVAGDGEKGAGFAPYLRVDEAGHPHILFSDHASEHFTLGQNEYAGQIRHTWHDGSKWNTRTVLQQQSPMLNQVIYPAFAISGNEMVVTGLLRATLWNETDYPRTVRSNYRFMFLDRQRIQ
ncbi:MAG: hypothetical protein SFY81_16270 [Verrucomicrobiota bacterium]|nr:hypothetical protein [Verrucomicrobiota bacterium]